MLLNLSRMQTVIIKEGGQGVNHLIPKGALWTVREGLEISFTAQLVVEEGVRTVELWLEISTKEKELEPSRYPSGYKARGQHDASLFPEEWMIPLVDVVRDAEEIKLALGYVFSCQVELIEFAHGRDSGVKAKLKDGSMVFFPVDIQSLKQFTVRNKQI